MQAPERTKPPLGVIFDSSMDESIDQTLSLALLFGLDRSRKIRVASVSTSRHNLKVAAFVDLLARFFGANQLPVGMCTKGPLGGDTVPMLAAALDKSVYNRSVAKLVDTADVVALMRNALSAQVDQNAAVILAGPPANLVDLLALPDGHEWVVRKAGVLAIAAGRFASGPADERVRVDVAGFRKLLAEWPSPVVFAGSELGEALTFPASAVEASFAWAPNHPVADAYRAYRPMPYDAPAQAMSAALYAADPDENYFKLSPPGTVTVLDDGRTQFTASAQGRHRYLIADPAQKERVTGLFATLAGTPVPPPGRGRGGAGKAAAKILTGVLAVGLLAGQIAGQNAAEFDKAVRPVLTGTCAQCHNADLMSGGLNVATLNGVDGKNGEIWQRILRRVRAGEMPPAGIPRPSADQMRALTDFVQGALDAAKPDPGRVTAHRLNRNEYSNTIRDLLGVDFRAEKYFPIDDSGDGFDNIGEILTVSPVLLERYMTAAERISTWALSTALPPKPVEAMYHNRDKKIRRVDRSTIEAEHRVEYAAEYVIRIGLPGERPKVDEKDAAPVTLGFWMDGKLLHSMPVETKPSGLVYFDPYSEEEMRLYLPEGDHVFRAGFIGDPFAATLTNQDAYNRKKNKFLDSILFIGPYPSTVQKESRKKILVCDPQSGPACTERILSTLARRAYRRPVTIREVAALRRFFDMAVADGQSAEQGLQLAIQAMLVSPNFLFRIEHDANPVDASAAHAVSEVELASRLSYFLWSSMPDDELLGLAEAGRLRQPGVLTAQVNRMLADPRSAAFAANFAGQWLETRNLDAVRPDPQKFPEWNPELRDAMKTETAMFFDSVLRENRPIGEFLSANYTFLNDVLARHYGIAGVTGSEFRRVELNTPQRGGVLSHASVLTVSSYPSRTSPVIRGKYILQNILGAPPPPPPPDVPALDEAAVGAIMSMREQLNMHRSNAVCASCHSRMDPLGFGLENYDATGKWRDMDGKFPVDASGTLPNGQTFSTPAEMRTILKSLLPDFSRTLTSKMLTYALGRGLQAYDGRTVDNINQELARDGYRFQTLIHQVVDSLPFQSRRGEDVAEKLQ